MDLTNAATLKEQTKIKEPGISHYRIHTERPFLLEERPFTTVLMGGLSPAHDYLFEATMKGLGIETQRLPPTNLDAFHLGREYGSNGFCNPAYFTIGNLVLFLKNLEKAGKSRQEIIEEYVYLTIGTCAPCRFGMYETEYRMALKDAGFEGFRVLAFQNGGGLEQRIKGDAFIIDLEFWLIGVTAIFMADAINDFVVNIRPYEVIPGKTMEVRQKALDHLYNKIAHVPRYEFNGWKRNLAKSLNQEKPALFLARFIHHLRNQYFIEALREASEMFEEVEIDRFRNRPTVKIIGEFWAQITEGAGNFEMFDFLEAEGATINIEPVAGFLQYLLGKVVRRHRQRKKVIYRRGVEHQWQIGKRLKNYKAYQSKLIYQKLAISIFRREYSRLLKALGGEYHMLLKQTMLEDLGEPYYNPNIEGSEGYMEVAKNIYYHEKRLAHMVLSLKPFGCLPSTQSDGTQAKVTEEYKNIIFLPIETAGEGKTNAHSRVLMSLGDARAKSKQEFKDALAKAGPTLEEMREYVEAHPELKKPSYVLPHNYGVANRAASFVYHVEELMKS